MTSSASSSCAIRRATDPAQFDAWMQASLAGDHQARRLLLQGLQRWLYRWFRPRLPVGRIDDAVQDTLLAFVQRLDHFQPGNPVLPWLAGIARFKWIDAMRATVRHSGQELGDVAVADHGDRVIDQISLAMLLKTLTAGQQTAIRLVKLEGLSIREAALQSGQSEALVKINIHRGLAAIRRRLSGDADAAGAGAVAAL